jgi:hypothetical protein
LKYTPQMRALRTSSGKTGERTARADENRTRRLDINAQIKQLEAAGGRPENVEVQSLARQAKALAIVQEPEEGGRTLEVTLG